MPTTSNQSSSKKKTLSNEDKDEHYENTRLDEETMDKISAIYDMLPIIKECYKICQFMLHNRGFNKAYKGYVERDSEALRSAELFGVLDYYGIQHKERNNVKLLYTYTYNQEEHIDIICKYLAIEWVAYKRDKFTFVPLPQDVKPQQISRNQVSFTGNAPWTP